MSVKICPGLAVVPVALTPVCPGKLWFTIGPYLLTALAGVQNRRVSHATDGAS